jgi:hypothetical protein
MTTGFTWPLSREDLRGMIRAASFHFSLALTA